MQQGSGQENDEIVTLADHSLIAKLTGSLYNEARSEDLEIENANYLYSTDIPFEAMGLKDSIMRAFSDLCFVKPSLVQATVLPYIIGPYPRNVIAQSQSGTGKSVAFVISALQLTEPTLERTQVVTILPTFELAEQVYGLFQTMGRYCSGYTVELVVRGSSPSRVPVRSHILVGSPGTLCRWLRTPGLMDLSMCRLFVLDEADVMIDRDGHLDACSEIRQFLPSTCQYLLCSATYNQVIYNMAIRMIHNPVCIKLKPEELSLKNIHQFYCRVNSEEEKIRGICTMYFKMVVAKTMVFCNTRAAANRLASQLREKSMPVLIISGDMPIMERAKVINSFRTTETDRVLICTNVCSRGIDIRKVNLVINYDVPFTFRGSPDYEAYLHRIGRGGRFGQKSLAITLAMSDYDLLAISEFQRYFSHEIVEVDILADTGMVTLKKAALARNQLKILELRKT